MTKPDTTTIDLDLRQLPPPHRHALIFATWEELAAGQRMRIINDHDPKPLYYQFQAEQAGLFSWEYEEKGPTDWKVVINRL